MDEKVLSVCLIWVEGYISMPSASVQVYASSKHFGQAECAWLQELLLQLSGSALAQTTGKIGATFTGDT